MSENSKSYTINVKDLSFKSDQHVTDLVRYLAEALPQIDLNRDGNEINVEMSQDMSKRALKLRLKKFLYKKGLNKDFRPITYKSTDKEGYAIKEKRIIDLDYY
ncbi:hypothetical protein LCGC14_1187380 [marine sediment metagenome]|uniref:Uncharacterized protein n=2 Tax=unclassified sequences TaxID=12908 RepID=A0A0F9PQV2_9ZZZZ|nr:putative ribosomal protein L22e-like protein [uncultured organism]KKK43061.1 MAG: hypothetical protein Lokiarch_30160 [Candidatus Lokiarchaeum sp. GC14_75]